MRGKKGKKEKIGKKRKKEKGKKEKKKKKGKKEEKKANPTARVLGSLTLPTHKPIKHFPPVFYPSFFNTTVFRKGEAEEK
ncbi:hypothetical protein FK518_28065 [Klebsiella pneumoniae]|nr:hypothetical protein [Klebsiella pneumoniae]